MTQYNELEQYMGLIQSAMGDERLTHEQFIDAITEDPHAFYGFRPHELLKLIELAIDHGKRTKSDAWPKGATVKLKFVGYGPYDNNIIGWGKRDSYGRIVSYFSGLPLSSDCWEVIAERVDHEKD